jgi:hypothetical protein
MVDKEMIDELIENLTTFENSGKLPIDLELDNFDENLGYFWTRCNGGYTKDNYFHFLGFGPQPANNVVLWNSQLFWKQNYPKAQNFFFFAEDVFGNQFGYEADNPTGEIFLFWVDDGRVESFAKNLEEFIEFTVFDSDIFGKMRALSEAFYGYVGSRVQPLHHISYKKPIILGGSADDIGNLEFSQSISHLKFLGQVVTQASRLPKGTKIKDVIINAETEEIILVPEL